MRKKRPPNRIDLWLLALGLLLAGSQALASPPPPFVIQDGQSTTRMTVYAEYLFDDRGAWTLNDVRSRLDDRFKPATRSRQRLGFHSEVVWMRFALRNETGATAQRILELAPGLFREIQFYQPTETGYRMRRSGLEVSPPWADIRHRHQLFELSLPPGETRVYYLRLQPELGVNFSLHLSTPGGQLERNLADAVPYWLFGGVIIGLMLFNLGLYFTSRHRAHLWYALFQGLFLVTAFTAAGFLTVAYLPLAGAHARIELTAELLAIAASALFTRDFLDLPENRPLLARLLKGGAWLCLGLALATLSLPTWQAGIVAYGTALLAAALLFAVGLRCLSPDIPQTRLYLLARSAVLLAVMLAAMASFNWIRLDLSLPLLMLVAAAVEGILFAAGLTVQRESSLRSDLNSRQLEAMEELTWRTRSETLARVSHEIRTPMSGILGMAELLGDTPLTPNQKECVRTIRSAGENLLRIINDVLEYSRLEEGGTDLNRDQFDLSDVVMDALELFRERAEEKHVELIAHIHTNVPSRVEGDPNKLRQVITSILAACVRHASAGEIVLDVGRDTSGRAHHLRFELEGSAIAHNADFLQPLQDPKPDNTDSTGLGLTIARQLTEAMGGQCGLREGRRQASICWVSIPLPEAPDSADQPLDLDPAMLSGRSMLVVDDSSTVTRVIRQQALNWGMRVTVSHDPREALASIRTQANLNEPFDIVLLDQHMPGMSGMQLAARIHEDPLISHPMVLVMLTGVQDAPTATQARNVGIHKVLSKPVSGARLKQALAEALGMLTRHSLDITGDMKPDPGLRILVAEDHLLSQKVIRGMLAKLGLEAEVVANGREAVAAVQAADYDIVLMDCEMPQMDGFEATRRIRQWEKETGRRPLPVVALTAHILREHRERSMASGMNAHVPKPVELSALAEVLVRFTRPAAAVSGPDSGHASDDRPG